MTRMVSLILVALPTLALAQQPRQQVQMRPSRAESLYVSDRPEDHPQRDFDAQIRDKAETDSIYRARSRGVMDFQKVSYKSTADGMTTTDPGGATRCSTASLASRGATAT